MLANQMYDLLQLLELFPGIQILENFTCSDNYTGERIFSNKNGQRGFFPEPLIKIF